MPLSSGLMTFALRIVTFEFRQVPLMCRTVLPAPQVYVPPSRITLPLLLVAYPTYTLPLYADPSAEPSSVSVVLSMTQVMPVSV